jgi:uncharacterized protein YciI
MLFVWIGFLRPGAESIPPSLQESGTDFLSQPLIKIRAAGPLRDESGQRAAMMMIFEQDSRDAAEAFVRDSPYLKADLYEDHRLYEYANEVG